MNKQINIIPTPKSIQYFEGSVLAEEFCLGEDILKIVPKAADAFGYNGKRNIEIEKNAEIEEEGYKLSISKEGIFIQYSAPNGLYYALTTLRQIALTNGEELPYVVITDAPDMKIRGYSDDVSRGQISTMENFKDIIVRLSYIKCNLYMPYIEDTLKFDCIPESGKYSDPMTKDEWKELCAFAKDYYVTITPIINTLGHWEKNGNLEAFEQLMVKDENGYSTSAMDSRLSKVKEISCAMMEEAAELFGDSLYVHAGGDEVFSYTRFFDKAKAAKMYNDHFKMLNEVVKSKGKKMMLYSDMYTPVWGNYQLELGAIDDMPDDILFVYWDYEARDYYGNIDSLKNHGKEFLLSPATRTWMRFLPQHYTSWLNTKNLAKQTGSESKGIIMSSWNECGINLREENWFGLYAGAMFSWNSKCATSFDETVISFYKSFFGIDIDIDKYHELFDYDKILALGPTNGEALCEAFWTDAALPTTRKLKDQFGDTEELFAKALEYFSSLKPTRNDIAYDALLFDIRRSLFTAKKINLQKLGAYYTREQAMADVPKWEELALEVRSLMDENERLWFATNRQSEWLYTKSRYEDLYNSIQSVIKYCKYARLMTATKRL